MAANPALVALNILRRADGTAYIASSDALLRPHATTQRQLAAISSGPHAVGGISLRRRSQQMPPQIPYDPRLVDGMIVQAYGIVAPLGQECTRCQRNLGMFGECKFLTGTYGNVCGNCRRANAGLCVRNTEPEEDEDEDGDGDEEDGEKAGYLEMNEPGEAENYGNNQGLAEEEMEGGWGESQQDEEAQEAVEQWGGAQQQEQEEQEEEEEEEEEEMEEEENVAPLTLYPDPDELDDIRRPYYV